jgi:hypothetical protein
VRDTVEAHAKPLIHRTIIVKQVLPENGVVGGYVTVRPPSETENPRCCGGVARCERVVPRRDCASDPIPWVGSE